MAPIVTQDMISKLLDPSPEFLDWVEEMRRGNFLEIILEAAKTVMGEDAELEEILRFLNELDTQTDPENLKLACADFKDAAYTKKISQLRQILARPKGDNLNFICGQIGHASMQKLVSSKHIFRPLQRLPKMQPGQLTQLNFNFTPEEQMSLFNGSARNRLLSGQEMILGDFIDGRRIRDKWLKTTDVINKNNNNWPGWYYESKNLINDLFLLLAPLIGNDNVKKLFRYSENSPNAKEFISLSILTWAAAVAHFWKCKPRIIFPEIRIFPHSYDISGGRADFIEVISINGRSPTKKESKLLTKMAKYSFKSFEDLMKNIWLVLKKKTFDIRIGDWKFFVGDCGGKGNLLLAKSLPQAKHLEQVMKYLVFCSFNNAATGIDPSNLIGPCSGELTYLLPTENPAVYPIQLGQEEKQRVYATKVLDRLDEAGRRAAIREATNRIVGGIIRQFKEKEQAENGVSRTGNGNSNSRNGKNAKNGHKNGQSSLFPEISVMQIMRGHKSEREKAVDELTKETSPVSIEEFDLYDQIAPLEIEYGEPRIFVDELGIIEKSGSYKNKAGIEYDAFDLHYDKLEQAINDGKIMMAGSFKETGFNVGCLFPEHQHDIHPSLRITLILKKFRCFVCGKGGKIISIPENIIKDIQSSPRKLCVKPGLECLPLSAQTIEIPEDHQKIMAQAQTILQAGFKGSPGESYIVNKRCLDPDLAYGYGAGFGDEKLIAELMKNFSWSYDQLIKYGFIGISEKITPNSSFSLMPFLKKLGMSDKDAIKEVHIIGGNKQVHIKDGYPFFPLRQRLTFPLTLNKIINNFYGRATYSCSKKFNHCKLNTQGTGMPHGMFNERILSSPFKEVIVTEAALEALTLIAMGLPNSLAVIGLKNGIITQTVADSGKYVAVALNNDPPKADGGMGPGQKATQELISELNAKSIVTRNFTKWFMSCNPDMSKDFNATWVNRQRNY